MATTFDTASPTNCGLLEKALNEYHGDYIDNNAKIGMLMAFGGKDKDGAPTGPAIKKNGVAVSSDTKIVPLKDRLTKDIDLEIIIDGDNWIDYTEAQKLAILDQALSRVELAFDKDEEVILDDQMRPKFKARSADLIFIGYTDVLERHGDDSVEYREYLKLKNDYEYST